MGDECNINWICYACIGRVRHATLLVNKIDLCATFDHPPNDYQYCPICRSDDNHFIADIFVCADCRNEVCNETARAIGAIWAAYCLFGRDLGGLIAHVLVLL